MKNYINVLELVKQYKNIELINNILSDCKCWIDRGKTFYLGKVTHFYTKPGDMANEFNGICWVKSYHDNPEYLYNTHLNVYCNYDGSYQYLEFENIYVNENSLSINLPQ
jgi:hypothetical protein|tara:strand:+ start:1887 stop:2213 length:327 start_codon:yes stop_codon:yes gene_type:complete